MDVVFIIRFAGVSHPIVQVRIVVFKLAGKSLLFLSLLNNESNCSLALLLSLPTVVVTVEVHWASFSLACVSVFVCKVPFCNLCKNVLSLGSSSSSKAFLADPFLNPIKARSSCSVTLMRELFQLV